MTTKKLSIKKKFRNSLIAISIIFVILFSGITPLIDIPTGEREPEPVWYDPTLADFLFEDNVTQTTYNFNAYNESYIICKIQNTAYTSFTFNSSTYNVSYGLNTFPIDFGTVNQSYSIGISQSDIDNNVFDCICVQPLIIKEDTVVVNLESTTNISFYAGGIVSILVQPNFSYNWLYLEVDNIVINNIYTTTDYPEVDSAFLIRWRYDGTYIQFDLDMEPKLHQMKIKGNGTIDFKIVVNSDWDNDLISDVEEIQKELFYTELDPTIPNVWGIFEMGDEITWIDNYINESGLFTFYIPENYIGNKYLSINVLSGVISDIQVDDDELTFKDIKISTDYTKRTVSKPYETMSSGFHMILYKYHPDKITHISFCLGGRKILVLDKTEFKDTDADGVKDLSEINSGTNPNNPDTDADGLIDNVDGSPLTSITLDKDEICQIIIPHDPTKNTLIDMIIKKPETDYSTTEGTRIWMEGYEPGGGLEVSIQPVIRIFGNSSITMSELTNIWDKNNKTHSLTGEFPIYGDGIPDSDPNGEVTIILGKISEYTFEFNFKYPINHTAKSDNVIDMRFDIVWLVLSHKANSTEIMHYYDFEEDIILQSLTKREVQNASYILASPDSMIENQILWNLVQNDELGEPSDFGVNDDIVEKGCIDYNELFEHLIEIRENNSISMDANGNINETEVTYVSLNYTNYDILNKINILNDIPKPSFEVNHSGDFETFISFYSISDVEEEDIESFEFGENVGEAKICYIKSWNNYTDDQGIDYEERFNIIEFPVLMKRTNYTNSVILEISNVFGPQIPLNKLPYSIDDISYDKTMLINETLIEKKQSSSGIPKISFDKDSDIYKEISDNRQWEVESSKLIFNSYSRRAVDLINKIADTLEGQLDVYMLYWMRNYKVLEHFENLPQTSLEILYGIDDYVVRIPDLGGVKGWIRDALDKNYAWNLPMSERLKALNNLENWLNTQGKISWKYDLLKAYEDWQETCTEAKKNGDPTLKKEWDMQVDLYEECENNRQQMLDGIKDLKHHLKRLLRKKSILYVFGGIACLAVSVVSIVEGISDLSVLKDLSKFQDNPFSFVVRCIRGFAKLTLSLTTFVLSLMMFKESYILWTVRLELSIKTTITSWGKVCYWIGIAVAFIDFFIGLNELIMGDPTVYDWVKFGVSTTLTLIIPVFIAICTEAGGWAGFIVGLIGAMIMLLWELIENAFTPDGPYPDPGTEIILENDKTYFSLPEDKIKRCGSLEVGDEVNLTMRIHNNGNVMSYFHANFSAGGSSFSDYEGEWEDNYGYDPNDYATLNFSRTLPSPKPNLALKVGIDLDAKVEGERIDLYEGTDIMYANIPILDNNIADFYDDTTELDKPGTYDDLIDKYEFLKDTYKHKDISETISKLSNRVAYDFLNDSIGSMPSGWSKTETGYGDFTCHLRPNGDDFPDWIYCWQYPYIIGDEDYYDGIDDPVEDPLTETDGQYIKADILYGGFGYWVEFDFSDFEITEPNAELIRVDVVMYAKETHISSRSDPDVYLSLDDGDNWHEDTKVPDTPTDSFGWCSVSWSADDLDDATDFDDLTIKMGVPVLTVGMSYSVDVFYVDIVYSIPYTVEPALISEKDGHINVMDIGLFGQEASCNFYKNLDPSHTSGNIEFWSYKDNYSLINVDKFFVIDQLGHIFEDDGETLIKPFGARLNMWNHVKVSYTSFKFDLYINGIKIGDDISHSKSNFNKVEFISSTNFDCDDEDRSEIIHVYFDAIDFSWSSGYYDGRSFGWDYSLANITYYEEAFSNVSESLSVWCLPDGDMSPNDWIGSAPHWDDLDEDPNDPDDNYIYTMLYNALEVFSMENGDIQDGKVYQVSVLVNFAGGIYNALIDLYFGGMWQGYQWMTRGTTQYYTWNVSGSQSDVNNMKVRFKSKANVLPPGFNTVHAFRAKVYYNEPYIQTNINSDLSENIIEMNTDTDIAEFDFDLILDGLDKSRTVNYSLEAPTGFTLSSTGFTQALDASVVFNVSANNAFEYAGIYYIDMNITTTPNNTLIYSEQIPFRIPVIESFQIDESDIIFNETSFNGNYTATHDWLDDTVDTPPDGWSPGGDYTPLVKSSVEDHDMIVRFYDTGSSYGYIGTTFSSAREDGIVECWIRKNSNDVNGNSDSSLRIMLYNGVVEKMMIRFDYQNNGKVQAYYSSKWNDLDYDFEDDTWIHVKIYFDCESDTFDLSIDNLLIGNSIPYCYGTSSVNKLYFMTDTLGKRGEFWVDAVGYSWDTNYTIGDNMYKTVTNSDTYESSIQLDKGDVVNIEYMTNSRDEIVMKFLNNDVVQGTYSVVPRGNLYKGIQFQPIIVKESTSFDEIEFLEHEYNYFEVYKMSIIDATLSITKQFNPMNFTNMGNVPEFVSFTFSGVPFGNVNQSLHPDEFYGEIQIITVEPNTTKTCDFDITLPNESISNLFWRGITYSKSGTNDIYNMYVDNLEIDGIHITSPKNMTYDLRGEPVLCEWDEVHLEIIPEEALVWSAYSLNGGNNITFTSIANVSIPRTDPDAPSTIQVFGNNSGGEMLESEVLYFILVYSKIYITNPLNETYIEGEDGYYPATYGFENEDDGTTGTNIDFVDGNSFNTCEIVPEFDEHEKVLKLHTTGGGGWRSMYNTFSEQSSGTIEFWINIQQLAYVGARLILYDSTNMGIIIYWHNNGNVYYHDGSVHIFTSYSINTWYHVKIEFECGGGEYQGLAADTFYVWIDGVRYGAYGFYSGVNSLTKFYFDTGSGTANNRYLDAIGYSWDEGYKKWDNIATGLFLNYSFFQDLDSTNYTIDGSSQISLSGSGEKIIPLRDGVHSIQLFGNNSYGVNLKSYVRYFTGHRINITNPLNKTYDSGEVGYYPGTYGFENDEDNTFPSGFTDSSIGTCKVRVIADIGGHNKVLWFDDNGDYGGSYRAQVQNYFDNQTYGTVEYWVRSDDVTDRFGFALRNVEEGITLNLQLRDDKWKDSSNNIIQKATGGNMDNPVNNKWYHIKIEFECTAGGYMELNQYQWRIFIDGVKSVVMDFYVGTDSVDWITIGTSTASVWYNCYIDAIGYSWDPVYYIGDNLEEGLTLSFSCDIDLIDIFAYSIDGGEEVSFSDFEVIILPLAGGTRCVQVFGKIDTTIFSSEKRYYTKS